MLKRVGPKRISRPFVRNEKIDTDWIGIAEKNRTIHDHKLVGSANPDHLHERREIVRNEPISGN